MWRKLLLAIVVLAGIAMVAAASVAVQRYRTMGCLRLMARG